ncbi:MAG: hypothetical protein L3K26_14445 [Candidatus Hydrogenedentes bacterium]|nr:hypothetical protein [Candidatus Hydrogenedentota bacterium]
MVPVLDLLETLDGRFAGGRKDHIDPELRHALVGILYESSGQECRGHVAHAGGEPGLDLTGHGGFGEDGDGGGAHEL